MCVCVFVCVCVCVRTCVCLNALLQVFPDVLRFCQHGLCSTNTAAYAKLETALQVLPLVSAASVGRNKQKTVCEDSTWGMCLMVSAASVGRNKQKFVRTVLGACV